MGSPSAVFVAVAVTVYSVAGCSRPTSHVGDSQLTVTFGPVEGFATIVYGAANPGPLILSTVASKEVGPVATTSKAGAPSVGMTSSTGGDAEEWRPLDFVATAVIS